MAAFCKRHGRKSVFASASNPDLFPRTPRIQYSRDRRIYEYGLRNVDRIFVQNEEQARLCRENLKREPVLVRNIYPMPARKAMDPDAGYILWVSTIRGLKRPGIFLDLAEAMPGRQFRMIGGPGDGERGLFDAIRSRAENIPNVRFLGFMPFRKTEEQFDEAQLFVNTSESEGFPNTFLQAWARGIPSVSFVDAGAQLNGQPVGLQVRSFAEMLETVGRLSLDEAVRLEEGRRCAEYVERTHSPDTIIELYEREFEELALPGVSGDVGPDTRR
jgi:glycosyltransferase involved in cell wall biosynthesis